MRDNQNIYLDKVVEFLVRDTKIDHDKRVIVYPFYPSNRDFPYTILSSSNFPLSLFPFFSKYCKNVYGLTDQEIKYVWKEYKSIILDKIKNGR